MAASRPSARLRFGLGVTAGLGAGAALLLFAPAMSRRTESQEVNIFFHTFQDTRGVTVLSPMVDLSKDFTDRTSIKAKFGVDAISASSDSCARCHPDGAHSGRAVGSLTVNRKYGETTVGLGAELSQENFYRATTISTSLSKNLNKANTTIAGGYSFSFNQPVLHPAEFSEKQYVHDAYLTLTQTLTKTTLAQVGVEVSRISGYQTSPFLRAVVNGLYVPSQSPDLRNRYAFSVRIKQALPGQTYLDLDYRRYHDNWQVDSNAFGFGLSHHFGERFVVNASGRIYDQTGAYFYSARYTGNPTYYTGDFRLFPFNSNTLGGRVVYTPKDGVFGIKAGSSLTFQYERYWTSRNFEAAIFTGGLTIPLGQKKP